MQLSPPQVDPASADSLAPVAADGRILDPSTLGDHIDRLFRAAWALSGSPTDAEDLVQETFALVLAKPRRIRSKDDIGYLLSVLRNKFIDSRRAAARRLKPEALPEGFEPVDPSSATRPDQAVEAREVFAAIAQLPESYRDALVAVDVAGLSYGEAASLLGTKEATITSRLFRARAQVARGMDLRPEDVQAGRD
jgi:RNA polymerase sigma-70 factor (ECF subfamily)